MARIDSASNPAYKELKRIRTKGEKSGFLLLEGERALRQLRLDGLTFQLFVRENDEPDATTLRRELFDQLSDTKTPQGVLMKLPIPSEKPFDDGPVLVLDRIMDPGNLGTLLRSASGFGIQNILLMAGSVSVFNSKVLRSSLGAVLTLNIHQGASLEDVMGLERSLFLADMAGEDFSRLIYPKNFALVIGNEASGISEGMRALPSQLISIPLRNSMESLNAAVAGGILMQALMR